MSSTAAEGSPGRLTEIGDLWADRGHEHTVYRLDGPVEYGTLLDVILDAQPDAVLLSGMDGDDALVRSVADVVWKFDNICRVLVDGTTTAVVGVVAVNGPPCGVAAAVTGQPDAAGAAGVRPGQTLSPAGGAQPPAAGWPRMAALLVSRGWARGRETYMAAAAAAETRAAIDACDRDGLTVTDSDGYRHAVGVVRYAQLLLGLLDDWRLGELVESAIRSADMWLGALEGLTAGPSRGWRRELVVPLLATGSSEFRPGLSVLIALDDGGGMVRVHPGSHRLRTPPTDDPPGSDQVPLGCGEAALIEAGCRFCLDAGRFLHLRFIRGWMKPDVLLAGPLHDQAAQLGEQARQWCGMDIGLPTSVEGFLSIEQAALTGGLARRKGSGI